MRHYAKLLRATLTASLMLAGLGGAAVLAVRGCCCCVSTG